MATIMQYNNRSSQTGVATFTFHLNMNITIMNIEYDDGELINVDGNTQ